MVELWVTVPRVLIMMRNQIMLGEVFRLPLDSTTDLRENNKLSSCLAFVGQSKNRFSTIVADSGCASSIWSSRCRASTLKLNVMVALKGERFTNQHWSCKSRFIL